MLSTGAEHRVNISQMLDYTFVKFTFTKRPPFYWKELSKFENKHSSVQLLQEIHKRLINMPDPEESEYSEYEDEEEGDEIEEDESVADKPKTNGEAKPAAAEPAAEEPVAEKEKPKPPPVDMEAKDTGLSAAKSTYDDLKSPTAGKNYAPPSIPKSVQRRQELYSSGKPSTKHSKEKLMRSEGIIPIQAGSNKYASQKGQTGFGKRRAFITNKQFFYRYASRCHR